MRAKKTLWISIQGILILFLAAIIVGNFVAMSYSSRISILLEQSTYKTVENEDGSAADTEYYVSDYASYKELLASQNEFGKQIQAEGSVLLQNSGLPIAKSGNITLLGAGCGEITSGNTGFIVGGGGSGSISVKGIPSIHQVFTDAGYSVNPVMKEYYTSGAGKSTRSTGGGYVGEQPLSNMTAKELESIDFYKDVGIVIIGRTGSEGADVPRYQTDDPEKCFLELSQNEIDLVDFAIEKFDKVVVLLNTLTSMDISAIVEKDVSILWIGAGGQTGLMAIPDLLNGNEAPSGRLVDTYAADLMHNTPSVLNQGTFAFTNVEQENSKNYYVYAESIYVGYKYYETRYADQVMKMENVGDYDYRENVVFPFGYGLSYTTFEYSDFSMEEKGENFEFEVTVTNTGETKGKEVLQIYMQSPYTQYDKDNGIEKSAVELVGFAKTNLLEPGKQETVKVVVPKEAMRAYDAQKEKSYIVDKGDYYFAVGTDAHNALNNILAKQDYSVSDGMTDNGNENLAVVYNQPVFDAKTYSYGADGEKITNEFDEADIRYYDSSFQYLSRSNWEGTFPVPYGDGQTEATAQMIEDMKMPVFETDEADSMPAVGANNELPLISLRGYEYDHEAWNTLLDQLTVEDMWSIVSGDGSAAIEGIGKPGTSAKDGPAGITGTLNGGASAFGYPVEALLASTWNLDIAEQMGRFLGEDSLLSGITGLYAPACNIHRSPFSGRNFEYYSEDGYISGKFTANVVEGAKEKGMYCFVKHFALNDQEAVRVSACTFSNEQTIRELYLKPFELAVREGKTAAMMSSYNHIGCVWSGHHEGLLTEVLRNEWGFTGYVLTDFMSPTSYEDVLAGIQVGQDTWMSSKTTEFSNADADNATLTCAMRESCHRVLYTTVNSNAMNGISVTTKIVAVTPAWMYWLIGLDVIVAVGVGVASFFIIRKIRRMYKEKYENKMGCKTIHKIVCIVNMAVTVIGIVLELIGGLVLSKTYGVGLNLNLSPLVYVGIAFIILGFVISVIVENVYNKKKVDCSLSHIAVLTALVAVLFAVIFLALVITLPVLMPSNG